jgi:hydroxymethylbilane synthase
MLRLATRGSQLALAQARLVAGLLEARAGVGAELVVLKTSGDRIQDRPLSEVGGKGLFVKEIEEALLRGDAEVAVHSMKDLPADLAPGLVLGAVPEREDPGDLLIAREPTRLEGLRRGARVGTSSLRRMALLLALRPDLDVVPMRGNVDTRLRKLGEGEVDALVLAAAGLKRLGIDPTAAVRLDPTHFVPAIGQGALAIETRSGELGDVMAPLEHAPTRAAVLAERGFMRAASGSCVTPLAAHARLEGDALHLVAVILSPDGARQIRGTRRGPSASAEAIGAELAAELLARGGAEILEALEKRG